MNPKIQFDILYFPAAPKEMLVELEKRLNHPVGHRTVLFVENDDHAISHEFYSVRRLIRKGLDLVVLIHPRFKTLFEMVNYCQREMEREGCWLPHKSNNPDVSKAMEDFTQTMFEAAEEDVKQDVK
ncbi:MAG: hypothetical protein HC899_39120 [Leptolyngbyaceae cyanobacterium SM1_4_3]|nr:hypothetical protein [Leptolyngbyaceae cyanobacterium SM1_4_3]